MDEKLIRAFKCKQHEYILVALKPLFYKYLQGISSNERDDFLQEYCILSMKIVNEWKFE